MARTRRRKFSPILARPIVFLRPAELRELDEIEDAAPAIKEQRRRAILEREELRVSYEIKAKMNALMAEYGLREGDPNCWVQLAFGLAGDFVPGLTILERRGRPRDPGTMRGRAYDWMLINAVEQIVRERGRGVADAARIALHRHGDVFTGTAPALEARYREAKRRSGTRQKV